MTEGEEKQLLELATDYALGSGLVYRPPASSPGAAPSTTSVIHAPYSLFPSPFPRQLFSQAQDLQPLYNALYAHVTVDDAFLHEVVGGAVAKVDEFQGRLYEMWKAVVAEGIRQVRPIRALQHRRGSADTPSPAPAPWPVPLGLPHSRACWCCCIRALH